MLIWDLWIPVNELLCLHFFFLCLVITAVSCVGYFFKNYLNKSRIFAASEEHQKILILEKHLLTAAIIGQTPQSLCPK